MVEFLYSFYLLINIVRLNFPISCFYQLPFEFVSSLFFENNSQTKAEQNLNEL